MCSPLFPSLPAEQTHEFKSGAYICISSTLTDKDIKQFAKQHDNWGMARIRGPATGSVITTTRLESTAKTATSRPTRPTQTRPTHGPTSRRSGGLVTRRWTPSGRHLPAAAGVAPTAQRHRPLGATGASCRRDRGSLPPAVPAAVLPACRPPGKRTGTAAPLHRCTTAGTSANQLRASTAPGAPAPLNQPPERQRHLSTLSAPVHHSRTRAAPVTAARARGLTALRGSSADAGALRVVGGRHEQVGEHRQLVVSELLPVLAPVLVVGALEVGHRLPDGGLSGQGRDQSGEYVAIMCSVATG